MAKQILRGENGRIDRVLYTCYNGHAVYLTPQDKERLYDVGGKEVEAYYSGEDHEEAQSLKEDLASKIKESNIGAYVEQLTNTNITDSSNGIPIAIKDNINVKNWEITC